MRILITGGTGSLGTALTESLCKQHAITIFSRDEYKQWRMRERFPQLRYLIGDIREPADVRAAIMDQHAVIHAAAMKQIPACEQNVDQAIRTNVLGALALAEAMHAAQNPPKLVTISTDKACKPVNAMGMTKALQERILLPYGPVVRYGNVLGSRGSIIPLIAEQIRDDKPITLTHPDMTRFLITLPQAVNVIEYALEHSWEGWLMTPHIYVPQIPAAKITDLIACFTDREPSITGVRPGEKIHEVLITEEELRRTVLDNGVYAIRPPYDPPVEEPLPMPGGEYCSANHLIEGDALLSLLENELSDRQ